MTPTAADGRMAAVDADAVEARLKALYAPPASLRRFALVGDDGEPVMQQLANGQTFAAVYGTRRGARVGCSRWGGRIWDRQKGEWG